MLHSQSRPIHRSRRVRSHPAAAALLVCLFATIGASAQVPTPDEIPAILLKIASVDFKTREDGKRRLALLVNRRFGGVCSPMKKGLKGTMPALVNSRVGSPAGINDALGMCWCPRSSKNRMNWFLI